MTTGIAPSESPLLITPREAADRLLEAATLDALRTNGHAGLAPVMDGPRVMFRRQDVTGYVECRLRSAA